MGYFLQRVNSFEPSVLNFNLIPVIVKKWIPFVVEEVTIITALANHAKFCICVYMR